MGFCLLEGRLGAVTVSRLHGASSYGPSLDSLHRIFEDVPIEFVIAGDEHNRFATQPRISCEAPNACCRRSIYVAGRNAHVKFVKFLGQLPFGFVLKM